MNVRFLEKNGAGVTSECEKNNEAGEILEIY